MGKSLERFGEVEIVDETNGFGLDMIEKEREWISECHPRCGNSTLKKEGSGICM